MSDLPTKAEVAEYRSQGVVLLRGIFQDWTDKIAAGIERNMAEPGPYASENLKPGEGGRFFDDYCNWQRIPEFREFVQNSPAAEAAAQLMQSTKAQIFHDHVLVKEPGTSKATPWHQDAPYYFADGEQTVSFWIPMEPVDEATLRCIGGSHKWPKFVTPTRWLSEENFYAGENDYLPVPDPDKEPENYRLLEWPLQPGDAVAFHYKTVHGARGNMSSRRRRAFSLRWLGDDARFITRPGRTSPPFPGHNMTDGQPLREDWFPIIWRKGCED